MVTPELLPNESMVFPHEKSKSEIYEGIAFTFCKAATIILIAGKFALPIAAGAAAVFYILAFVNGKKDTRCVLRIPILIALFWGFVAVLSLYLRLHPLVSTNP
jgi:hypothetical protein